MNYRRQCLLLLAFLSQSACSSLQPWVKPYERFNLSKVIMQFEKHPIDGSYIHHVYQAREAARGAEGGAGGGCGCN